MAGEAVLKVSSDMSGYVAGMGKGVAANQAFMTSGDEAARRTKLAQQAIAEAMTNGSNASARTIKTFTDSLARTADVAGKSKAEVLSMRAANLGLTDSVKPFIDQIAKASSHTHSFSLESAAAKRELLVLGHELSQGSFKKFGGSMLVLAQQTGAAAALFNPLVLGIGAAAAVLGIAVHSTLAARDELAAYGDTVNRVSKETGLSTDEVQRWGFAAKSVGVDTADAAGALSSLVKAQNEATHGNKESAAAFSAVGVSMATLKSASPEQLLAKVSDAFAKSADGAGKSAVANALFGSKWQELLPLLDQGSAHLAQLGVTADEVGGVLDSGTIQQLAVLKEHLEESQAKMVAMSTSAKTHLLPTIVNLTNAMADNVAMKPLMNDFYSGVAFIMKSAASVVATLVVGFQQTAEVIATTATVVGYGMVGNFKMASASAQAGFDNLKRQGQGYASFMKQLWTETTPSAAAPVARGGKISFAPGNHAGGGHTRGYQESRADTLMDQAKQAQASLQASLQGQEKLTGWAAKEVELRAEIDNLQGRTLTKAQQSVLAHKEALLAQYGINASLEKQLDLRTRQDKLNQEAYALNSKIADQNDAIAAQHKAELDALGLGTKERQRQADLLKIETDRQKELTEWAKKAAAQKLTGSAQDQDERTSINKRFDERRDELSEFQTLQDAASKDWWSGAKTGLQDIIDKTGDFATAAQGAATSAVEGLGDAVASFVTTGKLGIGDFARWAIASLVKMAAQALITKAVLGSLGGGSLGGIFGGSAASSAAAATDYGFHLADGGIVRGPGSSTSDSIPAWLSNGEGVLNAAAMKRLGEPALNALNAGASFPQMARFATGGVVGSIASPGMIGGGSQVNVYGAPAGTQVKQSKLPGGGVRTDVLLEQIESHLASGVATGRGALARSVQKQYGLNRLAGQS
ncbi:phage tail tape measure protein [Paraburkholderia sacchari]|uniref:phage tail tape measure protein n=1 Tax=Paraburkholderia sacchari TaxID=159450 RepID=UPI001BCFD9F8|nr:phage tail tape measure protein [Paraburkholderia sacchari]